jgi:hypothetical protein
MLARTTTLPKMLVGHSRFQRYVARLVDEARAAVAASSSADSCSDNNAPPVNDGGLVGAYLMESEQSSKEAAGYESAKKKKESSSSACLRRMCANKVPSGDGGKDANDAGVKCDLESAVPADAGVDLALISG